MKEHGLYIIKKEFFDLMEEVRGEYDEESCLKRPTYCCIKDNRIKGLYWAIPTSDLEHRNEEQKEKYNAYTALPKKDQRNWYYHIAKTTKKALYKISSCVPITDKYIDHEYTTQNVHVIMKKEDDIKEIERKLKRILAIEFRNNNKFPQRITDIRNRLIEELDKETLEEVAVGIEQ